MGRSFSLFLALTTLFDFGSFDALGALFRCTLLVFSFGVLTQYSLSVLSRYSLLLLSFNILFRCSLSTFSQSLLQFIATLWSSIWLFQISCDRVQRTQNDSVTDELIGYLSRHLLAAYFSRLQRWSTSIAIPINRYDDQRLCDQRLWSSTIMMINGNQLWWSTDVIVRLISNVIDSRWCRSIAHSQVNLFQTIDHRDGHQDNHVDASTVVLKSGNLTQRFWLSNLNFRFWSLQAAFISNRLFKRLCCFVIRNEIENLACRSFSMDIAIKSFWNEINTIRTPLRSIYPGKTPFMTGTLKKSPMAF